MALPKIRAAWIFTGLLILAAVVLHQFPKSMDVDLRVRTERVGFTLSEQPGDEGVLLIEGLSLASLTLSGLPSITLAVDDLKEDGKSLGVAPDSKIIVRALNEQTQVSFIGEGLRLMELSLGSGAQVTLYADRTRQMLMDAKSPKASRVTVGMLGRFELKVKDVKLVNGKDGKEIAFANSQPTHSLEVTPSVRNLIFELPEGGPFGLVMAVSEVKESGKSWTLRLPIGPRPKVSHLDFTEEKGKTRVSAINEFWGEPIIDEESAKKKVYLELQSGDVFTLRSLDLSAGGFLVGLSGKTNSLKSGNEPPFPNLMPSLLEYLANHVIFKTLCKPLGLC